MIVLLLGVAVVTAFVRVGDDDGGSRLAQTGPGTTVASTSTSTSTTAPATTPTTASATSGSTGASATATTTAGATTTTAAPGPQTGASGLGTGGAGEVAMGPTIPNTGIESALAPAVALLAAGVGLRLLLVGRRPHDA